MKKGKFSVVAVIAALFLFAGCGGGSSGGGGESAGKAHELTSEVTWSPEKRAFLTGSPNSAEQRAAEGHSRETTGIEVLPGNSDGISLKIEDAVIVGNVAKLKTVITNVGSIEDMANVTVAITLAPAGVTNDGPWTYEILSPGRASDPVEWTLTGVDMAASFTVQFKVSWTNEAHVAGASEYIVTGEYGGKYYVIDPDTKSEVAAVTPNFSAEGSPNELDVALGKDAKRVYFVAKAPGATNLDLYACDTLTGDNVVKLTSFNKTGVANPDVNPVTGSIVFTGIVGAAGQHLFVIPSEGETPVQLTDESELLSVPIADDPTISWGDEYPAYSPDGNKIAYVRNSKDTQGPNTAQVATVVIMDSDGSAKHAIWGESVAGASNAISHLCWSSDGAFVFFIRGYHDESEKVYAVHVATGTVSDLTDAFANNAQIGVVDAMWSSPSAAQLVIQPRSVNPDLYRASLNISGSIVKVNTIESEALTSNSTYRDPDWGFATKVTNYDAIGSYAFNLSDVNGTIATGDYGSKYYIVDPQSGQEIYNRVPGVYGVRDVTLSHDGSNIYFMGKGDSDAQFELYGCETLLCNDLTKLTSFKTFGAGNADASPVNDTIVMQAVPEDSSIANIYTVEGTAVTRISGDETLAVPGADDPTETWGDTYPAYSPDGSKIAYARDSKDTQGPNTSQQASIVVMDSDGSGKRVIWSEDVGGSSNAISHVCWSSDGAFVLFIRGYHDDKEKVYAVNVATGTVSDLTGAFASGAGGLPNGMWSNPKTLGIVYAPIDVNPDLYKVSLERVNGDQLSVSSIVKLTTEHHYRDPDWI